MDTEPTPLTQNYIRSVAPKRARAQLSCTLCRQGKLKCNRGQPSCDQCEKRARPEACHYVAPPARKKGRNSMRDRVKHLESLVVQLMNNASANGSAGSVTSEASGAKKLTPSSSSSGSPEDSTNSENAGGNVNAGLSDPDMPASLSDFGNLKVDDAGAVTGYVGSTHWEAILEDIQEVNAALDDDEEESPEDAHLEDGDRKPSQGSTFLLHASTSVTRNELLQSLPPKASVDRLVNHYFNSMDPLIPTIHVPTFQEEYRKFWLSPQSASLTWIALLYGVLCVATALADCQGPTQHTDAPFRLASTYHELCAAALSLSDVSKPTTYTLEALAIYSEFEYLSTREANTRLWLLCGLAVRLALKMGLHRDASHFPHLSPFHGEMRRRLWHQMFVFDVLTSFQHGMPSMSFKIVSDTQPPRNLLDSDFGPASTELPEARPPTDLTGVSYCIMKSKLVKLFARAADMSHAVTPPPLSLILELDEELEDIHDALPPPLRIKPLDHSITDPPDKILIRFNLDTLYQKTRCILHRRYMSPSLLTSASKRSRKKCVGAAIKLLEHHATLHGAVQPGGQLETFKWHIASVSTHDFLLAAMIICLELHLMRKLGQCIYAEEDGELDSESRTGQERVEVMRSLLEKVHRIWKTPDGSTAETRKACRAMETMLRRVGSPVASDNSTPPQPTNPTPSTVSSFEPSQKEYTFGDSFFTAAPTTNTNPAIMSSIEGMFDVPVDLDWGTWDTSIFDVPFVMPSTQDMDMQLNPAAGVGVPESGELGWFGI